MRILFLGDIMAEAGRDIVSRFVPELRERLQLDVVIANIENLAGGFGMTPETIAEVRKAGVDIMTGGNHSFDKKEAIPSLEQEETILRPANLPLRNPGKGHVIWKTPNGKKIMVLNLMGRTFMDPIDCPFDAAELILKEHAHETRYIFVDMHAETTAEKMALGWFLDAKVSAVVGTHTHVQTADDRILTNGTGFLSDAGMCGAYDSVIGMKTEYIIEKYRSKTKKRMETAKDNPWLCGAYIKLDPESGKTLQIRRIRIELNRPETHPRQAHFLELNQIVL